MENQKNREIEKGGIENIKLLVNNLSLNIITIFTSASNCVLGMDVIPTLFLQWPYIKKFKSLGCNSTQVQIFPIELPKIKRWFTKQYSVKGCDATITDT